MHQLRKLFLDELGDIYHVESMLLKALPKMVDAAISPKLKRAIEEFLTDTRGHLPRLEKVFGFFEEPPREKKCEAMLGLLTEGQHLIQRWKATSVLDSALICVVQKVLNHQIVSYRALAMWAELLEQQKASGLLKQTCKEEEAANKALIDLGLKFVHPEAAKDLPASAPAAPARKRQMAS